MRDIKQGYYSTATEASEGFLIGSEGCWYVSMYDALIEGLGGSGWALDGSDEEELVKLLIPMEFLS